MLSFTRTEPLLAEKKIASYWKNINIILTLLTNWLELEVRYILCNFLNIKIKLPFICLPDLCTGKIHKVTWLHQTLIQYLQVPIGWLLQWSM